MTKVITRASKNMISYLPNEISFKTQSLLGEGQGAERRESSSSSSSLLFTSTNLSTVGKER
jgi:hypothetical protein